MTYAEWKKKFIANSAQSDIIRTDDLSDIRQQSVLYRDHRCSNRKGRKAGYTIGQNGSVKIETCSKPHYAFHNHPSGETFSPKDLINMSKNSNILGAIVVGNNAATYSILRTETTNDIGYAWFIYEEINKSIYGNFSYEDVKEWDTSALTEEQGKELKQTILALTSRCAQEGEKYGFKYIERR